MPYATEGEMYPDVRRWLERFLGERFHGAVVDVRDTHDVALNTYIQRQGLQDYFDTPVWQTYDIKVDLTAFVRYRRRPHIVFVECKLNAIALRDVSQLLGYSRVAKPLFSYLISPSGVGATVQALVMRYDRSDILEYDGPRGRLPRAIVLARWLEPSGQVDVTSLLPPGAAGTM